MIDKPKVRPWVITPEDEEMFRATDATHDWLFSLSGENLRQYAGKWVAAKDCRIIATADTLADLIEQLGDTDLQTIVMRQIRHPRWMIYR